MQYELYQQAVTNLMQYELYQNLIYLKWVYTFQSNQIKFENLITVFFNNAIQQIISDTSKFEKLNEDPTLKREASLQ